MGAMVTHGWGVSSHVAWISRGGSREGYVLGVLQFINKLDDDTDAVIPFSDEMVTWVEALASQAAVALDNLALNQAQRTQLQSV